MAKYDAVRIKGKLWLALSNDQSVGVGGVNETGDVMLIQAMLRYISPFDFVRAGNIIPELTGDFNTATGDAIKNFQQEYSVRLLQIDGVIHPPSYEGRDLKNPFNPLMTITFLHILCKNTAKYYAHEGYTFGITFLFPQLLPHLRYPGMKTLPFLA